MNDTTQTAEYLKKSDVLQMIHSLGGCDATDEYAKGWDSALNTAYGMLCDMQSASDDDLKEYASFRLKRAIYEEIERQDVFQDIRDTMQGLWDSESLNISESDLAKHLEDENLLDAIAKNFEKRLDWSTTRNDIYWNECCNAISEIVEKDV